MDNDDFARALSSSAMIDTFINMIPARYYLPEDGVARKGTLTTSAIAETRMKSMKKSISHSKLSKNQLHEKLLTKIEEMKKKRQPLEDKDGTKGRRREKRAHEDISFADIVQTKETKPSEAKAGSKKRKIENSIRNIERQNEKVDGIEDAAVRTEAQTSLRMQKALQRAQGSKIHDNISKLKKTLKHKEKKKEKSKRVWKERTSEEKSKNEEKQSRRKENLQKCRTKKGKRRAGFEGQQGFLNKDQET